MELEVNIITLGDEFLEQIKQQGGKTQRQASPLISNKASG